MTSDTTSSSAPASLTMADLARNAALQFGDVAAARYLHDGAWTDMTYAELWHRVRNVALGLVGLGVDIGDRVSILCNTRLEFTIADLAASTAGAIVVPVYPSNSPSECEWVVGDSGAKVIICEDAHQVAKIAEVRGNLPALEHVVVIDGDAPDSISMADLAAAGADGDEAELDRRSAQISDDDACLIIYTSGTTGRPKGVVLTNRGFAAGRRSAVEMALFGTGDVIYLYLPLAHVFAQLIQADAVEVGATIAYWGGDTAKIVAELGQIQPHVLPSVPRIFEKVYALGQSMATPEQLANPDEGIQGLVRGVFGGRVKMAISGAAPIAPEILEFFMACGVPVYEGWGMTETTSIGTLNLPGDYRIGTIGKAVAGAEVRIAEDGEIQMRGPMLLREYWNNPTATAETMTADGWLMTGDLGSMDDDGYVTITGRKKDILITAGGKNLTPANLEGDLRRSQWISQAVMYADRRPYPVALITLDPETIVPWAAKNGLPTDIATLAEHEQVRQMIQSDLDAANAHYAKVEQIKKFQILDHDFSIDSGELTPTLKLKRNVVYANYADEFESLYD